MKKITLIALLTITILSIRGIGVSAKIGEYKEIETFFNEYSQLKETWENGSLRRGDDLYGVNDEKIGYIFRIYNKNLQQGYILYLDELGIVEATFEGVDSAVDIKGKVYYMLPGMFMSKSEYYEKENSTNVDDELLAESNDLVNQPLSSTGISVTGDPYDPDNLVIDMDYDFFITSSHVPDLSSNTSGSSTNFVSEHKVTNVPDYNNWSVGPIFNGCAPTSAAMLIAYYDNNGYNGFTEIEGIWWWQKFPLTHAGDASLVDELIIEMSDYLGNCGDAAGNNTIDHDECHGVSTAQTAAGLSDFLDDEGYDQFDGVIGTFANNVSDYQQLIMLGNPAIVSLLDHPTYGAGHAVLGIGFFSAYMSQPGIIIHDNWSTTGEEIWLSYNVASLFTFIYDN